MEFAVTTVFSTRQRQQFTLAVALSAVPESRASALTRYQSALMPHMDGVTEKLQEEQRDVLEKMIQAGPLVILPTAVESAAIAAKKQRKRGGRAR